MINNLQQQILKLKKERDVCILAHSYVAHDITEIADFTGDSYALSLKAKTATQSTILMCGVRFMAETVKMLSPNKRVLLAQADAGCPMAEQMTYAQLKTMREEHPDYSVVAYINTTAELKTLADVCVTSSSAVKVCRNLDNDKIIFIPDINLGTFVKEQIPEKKFIIFNGGCPVHAKMTFADVQRAKSNHPEALFLVHPECPKEVADCADYVGSTAGIMEFAAKSNAKEFIIGTENAIVEHLSHDCPDKLFYPLSKEMLCTNMKLNTLPQVLNCILGRDGEEILMSEDKRKSVVKCIDKMIELTNR